MRLIMWYFLYSKPLSHNKEKKLCVQGIPKEMVEVDPVTLLSEPVYTQREEWMLSQLLTLSRCPVLIRIIWSIDSNCAFNPFRAWWDWNWQQQQNAKYVTSSNLDLNLIKKTTLIPTPDFLLSNALLKQCCLYHYPVTRIFFRNIHWIKF